MDSSNGRGREQSRRGAGRPAGQLDGAPAFFLLLHVFICMHRICVYICICVYMYISLSLYICIYDSLSLYIYIYIHIHLLYITHIDRYLDMNVSFSLSLYIYIYIYVYIYIYISTYVYIYIYICVYIYIYIYICVYIYIYIYLFIHTYTHNTLEPPAGRDAVGALRLGSRRPKGPADAAREWVGRLGGFLHPLNTKETRTQRPFPLDS